MAPLRPGTSARPAPPKFADIVFRLLPFADAASDDLPLPRLLRLSLFQVSVGMAMVALESRPPLPSPP